VSEPDAAALLEKLHGTDRRSTGRVDEVVADVLAAPDLFGVLIAAMTGPDAVVRMRAADSAEKITRTRPELLAAHKAHLLGEVSAVPQSEVRWHVAQMLPRLELTESERRRAVQLLLGYLEDESSIERTFAMQALADLAAGDEALRERVLPILERLAASGTPSMRSRGRKLVASLRRARP
jgi:HEAT repeat protein